jgi:hypothetical protein
VRKSKQGLLLFFFSLFSPAPAAAAEEAAEDEAWIACDRCGCETYDAGVWQQCCHEPCGRWVHRRCMRLNDDPEAESSDEDDEAAYGEDENGNWYCVTCTVAANLRGVMTAMSEQTEMSSVDLGTYHLHSIMDHAGAVARRYLHIVKDDLEEPSSKTARIRTFTALIRDMIGKVLIEASDTIEREGLAKTLCSLQDDRHQDRKHNSWRASNDIAPWLAEFTGPFGASPVLDSRSIEVNRNLALQLVTSIAPNVLAPEKLAEFASRLADMCFVDDVPRKLLLSTAACIVRELTARVAVAFTRDKLRNLQSETRDRNSAVAFRSKLAKPERKLVLPSTSRSSAVLSATESAQKTGGKSRIASSGKVDSGSSTPRQSRRSEGKSKSGGVAKTGFTPVKKKKK